MEDPAPSEASLPMDSDRLEKRKADEEQPHPRITRGGSKSRMCLYVLNSCCFYLNPALDFSVQIAGTRNI